MKCTVYPNAADELRKFKELSACTRCGYLNRPTISCRFKFASQCRYCQGWHFSYLCDKKQDLKLDKENGNQSRPVARADTESRAKPKDHSKFKKTTASNSLIVTDVWRSTLDSDSILPNFSLEIGGLKFRAFKDGGCQSNFITESLAQRLNMI